MTRDEKVLLKRQMAERIKAALTLPPPGEGHKYNSWRLSQNPDNSNHFTLLVKTAGDGWTDAMVFTVKIAEVHE